MHTPSCLVGLYLCNPQIYISTKQEPDQQDTCRNQQHCSFIQAANKQYRGILLFGILDANIAGISILTTSNSDLTLDDPHLQRPGQRPKMDPVWRKGLSYTLFLGQENEQIPMQSNPRKPKTIGFNCQTLLTYISAALVKELNSKNLLLSRFIKCNKTVWTTPYT